MANSEANQPTAPNNNGALPRQCDGTAAAVNMSGACMTATQDTPYAIRRYLEQEVHEDPFVGLEDQYKCRLNALFLSLDKATATFKKRE